MDIQKHNNYVQELISNSKKINYPQEFDGTNPLYLLPIYERLINNCYCYSLGFKISSPACKLFRPGWISNYSFYESSLKENGCLFPRYESKEKFISAVLNDIEKLKIAYEIITTEIDINKVNSSYFQSSDNQSTILVAGTGNLEKGEFHFVRSDLKGFSHKLGWYYPPEQIDNIEDAFEQCNCEPCLVLRLKNYK